MDRGKPVTAFDFDVWRSFVRVQLVSAEQITPPLWEPNLDFSFSVDGRMNYDMEGIGSSLQEKFHFGHPLWTNHLRVMPSFRIGLTSEMYESIGQSANEYAYTFGSVGRGNLTGDHVANPVCMGVSIAISLHVNCISQFCTGSLLFGPLVLS